MMNILITGIHGFVGSNLVRALKDKYALYGLDIVSPDREGVIRTFGWEHLKYQTMPPVDVIIHLAGKAHDTGNKSEAQVYFDINTGLTKTIYDYFLTSQATKFIFFSSVKAVTDHVNGAVLTEEVIPDPKGPYGESKKKAEQYILKHLPGPATGKSVYILRPCMIHGPGNKGNLNLLYQVVQKGIPWPLGAFENRRSFVSADNLCFITDRLIASPVASGIYQIADDEALSTNELIEVMCDSLGRKPRIVHFPKGLIQALSRVGGLLHLPLNPERLRKLTENYVVSNTKLKEAVGLEKMPVNARDGLKKTLKSLMNIRKIT
jgi:nucleoside-diphosphate-sugar epimerase